MDRRHILRIDFLFPVRLAGAAAVSAFLVFALWALPVFGQAQGEKGPAGGAVTHGKAIYDAACAPCHGIRGDGRGPGAAGFAQPPTVFRRAAYKFRSTPFGALPTDADLERSIREGMPGTEMVPFGQLLSKNQREAVAGYLKTLSPIFAAKDGGAAAKATQMPAKRPFPASEQTVAAGRKAWAENDCADCHGERGEGNSGEEDEQGRAVMMIPFSLGYYKSGRTDLDLYRTIATGMNGTTMEAFGKDISPEEIWRMVDFIRSLESKPGLFGYFFSVQPSGFGYGRD